MAITGARLREIATAFRNTMEQADRHGWGAGFDKFPAGTCGVVSELLGRYLEEYHGVPAMYVCGTRRVDKRESHAWLICAGFIVDITADQFGQPPVIVERASPWHETWRADDNPRLAATPARGNWPDYLDVAWGEITAALPPKRPIRPS